MGNGSIANQPLKCVTQPKLHGCSAAGTKKKSQRELLFAILYFVQEMFIYPGSASLWYVTLRLMEPPANAGGF